MRLIPFLLLLVLICISCQKSIDIKKEQDAIKSVIQEEVNAFYDRNFEMMASTWIQKPTSIKFYMGNNGQTKLIGWDKISEDDKNYMLKDTSDRKKINVQFSDYNFNISENNAWVMLKVNWYFTNTDNAVPFEQTRILAFEKSAGKWKYTLMAIYNVPRKQ